MASNSSVSSQWQLRTGCASEPGSASWSPISNEAFTQIGKFRSDISDIKQQLSELKTLITKCKQRDLNHEAQKQDFEAAMHQIHDSVQQLMSLQGVAEEKTESLREQNMPLRQQISQILIHLVTSDYGSSSKTGHNAGNPHADSKDKLNPAEDGVHPEKPPIPT